MPEDQIQIGDMECKPLFATQEEYDEFVKTFSESVAKTMNEYMAYREKTKDANFGQY